METMLDMLEIFFKKNPYALTCFPAIIAMFVNANSFPVIGSEWSPVSPPIYALIIFIFVYIKKILSIIVQVDESIIL